MKIFSGFEELIGGTPLVEVAGLDLPDGVTFAVKCEWLNPGGSMKDRTARSMLNAAEAAGLIGPGGVIVEPTSGNTGVGLAMLAAQRGYRCVLVCTDKVAAEKVALMRAHGADVVVCPVDVAPDDPRSYYSTAARLTNEIPGAWSPNQYANDNNIQAHIDTTGPEIWEDTDGKVTHVLATAGTGGTVTGLSRYLKSRNHDVQIVAVDAEGSVYSGGDGRPYLVEGPGEDFFPATYDPAAPDLVIPISDADAFRAARAFTRHNGVLIGGSGGSIIAAVEQLADTFPPGSVVVGVLPDSGRGYLTKFHDDGWYTKFGFTDTAVDGGTVADLLAATGKRDSEIVWVTPDATVGDARELMLRHRLSQIPVFQNPPPLTPGESKGAVLAATLILDNVGDSARVGDVMGAPMEFVGVATPLDAAGTTIKESGSVLVTENGRVKWLVTRDDWEEATLSGLNRGEG